MENKNIPNRQDTVDDDHCMLDRNILNKVFNFTKHHWEWSSQVTNGDKNLSLKFGIELEATTKNVLICKNTFLKNIETLNALSLYLCTIIVASFN